MKNLKALTEKRAEIIEKMEVLTKKAQTQVRALTEEENTEFQDLKKQVEELSKTIKSIQEIEDMKKQKVPTDTNQGTQETVEQKEERAFKDFLTGKITEQRAGEMTFTDNGAVIPKTILNKIITKVYDICPIYEKATKYNVRGTLSIPKYPADEDNITMAFADEFTELTSTKGKFANIELTGYLAGALCKVSKSLINNAQFDIVNFVINEMAQSIARFIEKVLLKGESGKVDGLTKVILNKVAKSQTAVTVDELVQVKDLVKDAFQKNACWIMSPNTRTAIRTLKDGNGRFLLEETLNGNMLLGKPVFVSDQMDDMAQGNVAIYYGDMSGLAVKVTEDASIQVLKERFATEHAVGVVAWLEIDSKLQNEQVISKLTMKA